MSTKSKSAALFASIGVITAGWSIGTAHGQTVTTTAASGAAASPVVAASSSTNAAGSTSSNSSATSSASTSSATKATTAAAASAAGASGTYTGSTESDRYGSLTVTVTMANGKITDVSYTTTAGDGHSLQIENRAIPTLTSEVIAANSAQVSTVGGATYTSEKYLTSLQSALDQVA